MYLKNVLDTVKALHLLLQEGVKNFHFTIIGDGEQKQEIEDYIKAQSMQEYISILPFIPAEEVRQYMDKADIYVFGSNFYEGWGAVVNEAMDSACAMVVSHAVGSAPYLIENEKNGLLFKSGNIQQLAGKLKQVILDKEYRKQLAINGYRTITQEWTAAIAVERLLQISKALNQDEPNYQLFDGGVCSPAEPLKNNWFKNKNSI